MKLIEADVFESVLEFADADVYEESPDGHCDFGFSRGNIRELLRDISAVDAVLWDSGMSKDDVHAILGKILDRFDTIKRDYATMEDYRIMLREEAGIEIQYC